VTPLPGSATGEQIASPMTVTYEYQYPIGPQYMTELVDHGTSDTPYRG
jgi:hypothetical protein